MFRKEEVEKILEKARRMDPRLKMSGASKHQYKLNPPVDLSFVRAIEEEYHFRLPEDYVQFITEIGDGGAGPGYGLYSFGFYRTASKSAREARMRDSYLCGLSREPQLLPLELDDLEDFCIMEEAYKQNPDKYFAAGSYHQDNHIPYGFFHLGTYGCARDYGLITAGEKRGQVLIYGMEGAFEQRADSFQAFYQEWLDSIWDCVGFKGDTD